MTAYPHLFSPLRIGSVKVPNRVMQTGHGKRYAWGGADTQRDIDYQVERARGGVGLMITGSRPVHPTGAYSRATLAYHRKAIAADRRVVAAVREHGTIIFAQLAHLGSMHSSYANDDPRVLWGPSAAKSPSTHEAVKAMELADIHELVKHFGRSAEIAREGGYDGLELHFAHSYLIHQFISPMFNFRDDDYGRSFENRLRLPLEILAEVRRRVGTDTVVGIRMGMTDFLDGALELDEGARVAATFAATNAVDYLSLSAAGLNKGLEIAPSDVPDGWLLDSAAHVKRSLGDLPVFVVGGIKDPATAEEIIASGKGDMVGMTRAIIADPELVNKVREGREDDIVHCIRANQGCIARVLGSASMACTVNPGAGREGRFGSGRLRPASPPRRWLVIGGGPAGLKAAETFARRGHETTLWEREERLGGQVNLIVRTPGREALDWIVRDLSVGIRKHGVKVVLGCEATADEVAALAPDGIVVATGAIPDPSGASTAAPLVRRLVGGEQDHVVSVWDVLENRTPIGARVLVLDDDGTRRVAGTAEVLLDSGHQVEVVTRFSSLFPSTALTLDQGFVYTRLLTKGLSYRINAWARAIEGDTVRVFDLFTGRETVIEGIDTVVLATGPLANDGLYLELVERFPQVYRIGDCVAPRKLDHAIYEGFVAGQELWSYDEREIIEGELEVWAD